MQQLTRNKFVSPTTAGTMDWARLGILISLIAFPEANILLKLLFATLLSLFGTMLFMQILRRIQFKDVIFIPLVGIMLGNIVSSFSSLLHYVQMLYKVLVILCKVISQLLQVVDMKFFTLVFRY